jgi:hypothetical protein
MYLNQIVLRDVQGNLVVLRVGDELVEPGIPFTHKRTYVGPIGPGRRDVLDVPKGQRPQFVYLQLIPNWQRLIVGERGPDDSYGQSLAQRRARQAVMQGGPNKALGPNCEHYSSFVRTGEPRSPQLRLWGGLATAVVIALLAVNGN